MTISEIAKLAGVSNSAVSRYLNGGSLSEEKREIIRKVIEETNYVPSSFARSLRTKKSNQVGVIVPKIDSEAVPRIVSGIAEILNKNEYQFFLADTDNDCYEELKYIDAFQRSNVDGIILLATIVTKKHRDAIAASEIPIVMIGQEAPKCSCVFHDDEHAAYDLTSLLIENGCKKIGLLCVTDKDKAVGAWRSRGFRSAIREHGYAEENYVVQESGFRIEDGRDAMKKLLDAVPDLDGVFCATDNIAVGALLELKSRGIRIPEQMKLCGIGDNRLSDLIEPRITTAHYYYRSCGREAASMLVDLIEHPGGRKTPDKRLMLSYEIVRKDTL